MPRTADNKNKDKKGKKVGTKKQPTPFMMYVRDVSKDTAGLKGARASMEGTCKEMVAALREIKPDFVCGFAGRSDESFPDSKMKTAATAFRKIIKRDYLLEKKTKKKSQLPSDITRNDIGDALDHLDAVKTAKLERKALEKEIGELNKDPACEAVSDINAMIDNTCKKLDLPRGNAAAITQNEVAERLTSAKAAIQQEKDNTLFQLVRTFLNW